MTPPNPDHDNVTDFEGFKKRARADTEPTSAARAGDWDDLDRPRKPMTLHQPAGTPTRFRVRVVLVDSEPPIWRQLSLSSSITLDVLHDVLQTAFGWTNSHLHRFSPSSDPYQNDTEGILTPFDVEEGDEGVLESELRLDQLLSTVGDTLHYTYDFGDDWQHSITLEAAEPIEATDAAGRDATGADSAAAAVRCLDGGRRGPAEDSGGVHGWETLLAIATGKRSPDYPEQRDAVSYFGLWNFTDEFDIDGTNRGLERLLGADAALARLRAGSAGEGPSSPLAALFAGAGEEVQRHLAGYLSAARMDEPVEISENEATKATAVFRTYLRHVSVGIRLTGAGFLVPAAVVELLAELDPEKRVYGQGNRENNTRELLDLREAATQLGLVRKYRGELLLTKRGTELQDAPIKLWRYVAARLPLGSGEFAQDSGLLLLLLVASGEAGSPLTLSESLDSMAAMLGWESEGGRLGAFQASSESRNSLEWAGTGSLLPSNGLGWDSLGLDGARTLARAALATSV
ncbi:plasmid pRiA4b ORF-3 family protein [Glaciibacter superstes]|uniref:plasmid pRiA4b ORF-3 family protein n=1 Tax=Glaciibacter superstes TaxID=501023 RepID=UPI0003B519A1|nr:plasmid pRiA4b ORF-3 family protein [Glaciibacter superstes]